MSIEFVSTGDAPKAIGPYSQATLVGNLIFTAGQIAMDPASGEAVPGGSAGLQNRDGDAFGDPGGFDSHTLPPSRSCSVCSPPPATPGRPGPRPGPPGTPPPGGRLTTARGGSGRCRRSSCPSPSPA